MFQLVLLLIIPLPNIALVLRDDSQQDMQVDTAVDLMNFYDDVDDSSYKHELAVKPWLILPIPLRSKKALAVFSRWRPLNNYIRAAATAAVSATGVSSHPETLDFVTAETRARSRSRPRVQPLRWGRRKRTDASSQFELIF